MKFFSKLLGLTLASTSLLQSIELSAEEATKESGREIYLVEPMGCAGLMQENKDVHESFSKGEFIFTSMKSKKKNGDFANALEIETPFFNTYTSPLYKVGKKVKKDIAGADAQLDLTIAESTVDESGNKVDHLIGTLSMLGTVSGDIIYDLACSATVVKDVKRKDDYTSSVTPLKSTPYDSELKKCEEAEENLFGSFVCPEVRQYRLGGGTTETAYLKFLRKTLGLNVSKSNVPDALATVYESVSFDTSEISPGLESEDLETLERAMKDYKKSVEALFLNLDKNITPASVKKVYVDAEATVEASVPGRVAIFESRIVSEDKTELDRILTVVIHSDVDG